MLGRTKRLKPSADHKMRVSRGKRGVVAACICSLALINLQCARDGRENETDGRTLTIHAQGSHEFQFGLGNVYGAPHVSQVGSRPDGRRRLGAETHGPMGAHG